MAKGYKAVAETGPPGERGPATPSETAATAKRGHSAAGTADGSAEARLGGTAARQAVKDALAIVPVIITRIELWKTERLVPLARNPRTHSDEQIGQIAASMREFGFLWPIIVNGATREIVAGNGRYLAAVRLSLPTVPVVEEGHLTPVQRRAFIIADNKIALNAGWADDILAEELPALGALGFDLGITGFSEDEIAEILASVEPARVEEPPLPPLPEQPVTRRGDLWTLGTHRVLCGDATRLLDLQTALDGRFADVVWTDPPYNVDYEAGAGTIQNDALSDQDFARFLKEAFTSMFLSMQPGAPIYVAHSDTGGYTFRRCFIEAGFKLASGLAHAVRHLGDVHYDAGRLALAEPCYQEALALYHRHGQPRPLDHANAIRSLAVLKHDGDAIEEATGLWQAAHDLYAAVRVPAGVAESAARLALLARRRGDLPRSREWLGRADAAAAAAEDPDTRRYVREVRARLESD